MSLAPSDCLAILQLATRADACATARDADSYIALFTDDAVMDGDQGTVRGRDALRTAVARVWAAEPPGTLHLTLNALIDETSTEPAVTSVLLLVTPGHPMVLAGCADIRQVVQQTATGWKIRSRTIHMQPLAP